jgi:hypothetical protein
MEAAGNSKKQKQKQKKTKNFKKTNPTPTSTSASNPSKNALIEYFANKNAIAELRPEYQSTAATISGLDYIHANVLVNIISITLGIIIFALIPYVANNIRKPITSAILNVVPNGMILGYFIVAKSFIPYFTGLIFAPSINPLLDLFTYYLYEYVKLSAKLSLCIGIGVWALMVLVAYVLKL